VNIHGERGRHDYRITIGECEHALTREQAEALFATLDFLLSDDAEKMVAELPEAK